MRATNEAGAANECVDHGCKGFGMGYATAWVVREGVKVSTTLHRKVFYESTGEWPEVVRHTCDNARCINPQHLIAGTQKDNVQDMLSRGRNVYGGDPRRGEARGYGVRLSDAAVRYIKDNYVPRHSECGVTALAKRFSVSQAQLSRIVNGTRRKTA